MDEQNQLFDEMHTQQISPRTHINKIEAYLDADNWTERFKHLYTSPNIVSKRYIETFHKKFLTRFSINKDTLMVKYCLDVIDIHLQTDAM